MEDYDFDPSELAQLRLTFRDEAHELLDLAFGLISDAQFQAPAAEDFAEILRVLHAMKGAAGTVRLTGLAEAAHQVETALLAYELAPGGWPQLRAPLLDIVDEVRAMADDAVADPRMSTSLRLLLSQLTPQGSPPGAPPSDGAVVQTEEPRPVAHLSGPHPAPTTLRVAAAKLDAVQTAASELLFDRTRIERRAHVLRTLAKDVGRQRQLMHDELQRADAQAMPQLHAHEAILAFQATQLAQHTATLVDETDALRRTISELQRALTALRLESAQALFLHLMRALRALRRATGVDVDLVTVGDHIEFDKSVADALRDPLVQLIRNAVSHGMEPLATRLAKGKPGHGTITVTATQDQNQLSIEVRDDGKGIDVAALRARLVSSHRWSAARAAAATDEEVLQSLLTTQLSLSDDITELAGHGIGLDSVRQSIAKLGGQVIVASTLGRGTTFELRIPLATMLARALLFKVAGQTYAVPSTFVAQTLLVDASRTHSVLRHEHVPILALERTLGGASATGTKPAFELHYASRSALCTVDKIVGHRDIVIKQLPSLLAPLTLYTGATISGSGKLQLILDPAQLIRLAHPKHHAADAGSAPLLLAGRVLVVDDSRAIREAMTTMLTREGWVVDVARDGQEGLRAALHQRYDLFITDLEMPGYDGWWLISQLAEQPHLASVPLLIISSRLTSELRQKAEALKARGIITKPITRRKLLEALAGAPPAPSPEP